MDEIIWFKDCSYKNKHLVGGKCSSLGELYTISKQIGFSIGDGSDVDRWGSNVAPGLNETTDGTDYTITAGCPHYAAATSVVLTQVGGSTFVAGGVVRVVVHCVVYGAPNT